MQLRNDIFTWFFLFFMKCFIELSLKKYATLACEETRSSSYFPPWYMVSILGGNAEYVAHVYRISDIFVNSEFTFVSIDSMQRQIWNLFLTIGLFSRRRAQLVLTYHLIYEPIFPPLFRDTNIISSSNSCRLSFLGSKYFPFSTFAR